MEGKGTEARNTYAGVAFATGCSSMNPGSRQLALYPVTREEVRRDAPAVPLEPDRAEANGLWSDQAVLVRGSLSCRDPVFPTRWPNPSQELRRIRAHRCKRYCLP
jgi:hypothetical protein